MVDVIVIGGGLGGLTAAIHLSKGGCEVLVIEKNDYPHHKVCGEYVSNEVLPYLQSLDINPFERGAVSINQLEMTSLNQRSFQVALPTGGFGISRYAFDELMYQKANETVQFLFDTVVDVTYKNHQYTVKTQSGSSVESSFVIGAYGKRSSLDKTFSRYFINQKHHWLAVKQHYEHDSFPENKVALHCFNGGYCGLSTVETGHVNVCYLTNLESFKQYKNIELFEEAILSKNNHLNAFFQSAKPVFDQPLTISQIAFGSKELVHQKVIMIGDAAGLIHPLCGNGMAMAIHSAKLLSELLLSAMANRDVRFDKLAAAYQAEWNHFFQKRLRYGRFIQQLLFQPFFSQLVFYMASKLPSIIPSIVNKTHGKRLTSARYGGYQKP